MKAKDTLTSTTIKVRLSPTCPSHSFIHSSQLTLLLSHLRFGFFGDNKSVMAEVTNADKASSSSSPIKNATIYTLIRKSISRRVSSVFLSILYVQTDLQLIEFFVSCP